VQDRISIYVYARDPISQIGITGQLRDRPEVVLVGDSGIDDAAVALLVADEVDEDLLRSAKAIQRNGCPRVVLLVTRLDDAGLLTAVEAGVCGMLRRDEAHPDALVAAARNARNGDGTVPPDLLGRLLQQVGRLQRQVLPPRRHHQHQAVAEDAAQDALEPHSVEAARRRHSHLGPGNRRTGLIIERRSIGHLRRAEP